MHKRESLLLLNDFSTENSPFNNFPDIIDIVSQFKHSDILVRLGELYEEENQLIECDWEFEIKKRDQQILQLKSDFCSEIKKRDQQILNILNKPKHINFVQTNPIKIALVGGNTAGKTTALIHLCDGIYKESGIITSCGVDFKRFTLEVFGQNVKLLIWDTAGNSMYRASTAALIQRVNGVLLFYDITNKDHFLKLDERMQDINESSSQKIITFLVGNKIDIENEREVSRKDAEDFANKYGLPHFETSSKDREKLLEILTKLTESIILKAIAAHDNSFISTGSKKEEINTNDNSPQNKEGENCRI